ncbi:translation initiation factor IF-2-like isoform X2 [Lutra lutra]|uniref:translation initiation factor IF-2-like isoform X2 n=1 Tax=Lutra lutra TaxID=9657 RepID=UPI001FD0F2C4|nr:translation initiation factor IF-2-like isoform X2 [Lutra lutra]
MTPTWGPQNVTQDIGKMGSPKGSTSCVRQLRDSTQAAGVGGRTCPASSPDARPSFVWWLGGAATSGDRWGGSRHPLTFVPAPLPPCAPCSPRGAGCSAPGSRRLVGRGPGAPNSPREPPRRAAGEGRALLPLPRCVTGGGGTARCGRRCAAGGGGARGAVRPYLAIWAPREPRPPPGKPRPGQPRPRPPPALSHRPGGGGSNGRGAPGALLALFSQGGRRLAGGTKGRWRAAGAGAEGASPSPAPTPGSPRPRCSAAGPAATVGVGLRVAPRPHRGPVAAGGGCDAGLDARPGSRGVTALLGSSTGSLGRVDAVGPGSRQTG